MGKGCGWCGKSIGFLDMSFVYMEAQGKEFIVCGDCARKISSVKKGETPLEAIVTEATAPELLHQILPYSQAFEEYRAEIEKQQDVRKQQQKVKDEAREVDPLYEDIHQIAGDLRFIKNWLIINIVAGIILLVLSVSLLI